VVSVGGVVQHVRSRCPCSGVWALTLARYVPIWLNGNTAGRINEVSLRRAGLVLRRVTVCDYTILVFNQVTRANSAWPSIRG